VRHLLSLVFSVVATVVWYIVVGLAISIHASRGGTNGYFGDQLIFIALLVLGGGLYAATLLPRLSPVGPGVAGLVVLVLGMAQVALADGARPFDTLPADLFGQKGALAAPSTLGITTFAAIPMLLTMVVPSRWRGNGAASRPVPGAAYGTTPAPAPIGSPVPLPPPAPTGPPAPLQPPAPAPQWPSEQERTQS
jgi:hypothetical protein